MIIYWTASLFYIVILLCNTDIKELMAHKILDTVLKDIFWLL